jgi:hypothetical protein
MGDTGCTELRNRHQQTTPTTQNLVLPAGEHDRSRESRRRRLQRADPDGWRRVATDRCAPAQRARARASLRRTRVHPGSVAIVLVCSLAPRITWGPSCRGGQRTRRRVWATPQHECRLERPGATCIPKLWLRSTRNHSPCGSGPAAPRRFAANHWSYNRESSVLAATWPRLCTSSAIVSKARARNFRAACCSANACESQSAWSLGTGFDEGCHRGAPSSHASQTAGGAKTSTGFAKPSCRLLWPLRCSPISHQPRSHRTRNVSGPRVTENALR